MGIYGDREKFTFHTVVMKVKLSVYIEQMLICVVNFSIGVYGDCIIVGLGFSGH